MSTIVPFSNEDPEKIFTCPYDKVHTVRACRFNQHLRKCRKNHGGIGFSICAFNQSHHIPTNEYDRHLLFCPDRDVIQQDVDEALGAQKHILPPVDHHPEWDKPETTEDWDTEFEHHQIKKRIEEQARQHMIQDANDEEEIGITELLPEHPPNWESMTATQKKNYRRRYKKQQDKLKENGLTPADFKKSKNPEDWTDQERDAKIKLMLSLYPPAKIGGTFIDYKSVLNQYCQKNKINQPKYMEAASGFSGFASEVIVNGQTYRSHGLQKTKKDAAHSAAKWALMAMEVAEEEPQLTSRLRPARTAQEVEMLRLAHEVGLIQHSGQISKPVQQRMQPVSRAIQPQNAVPAAVMPVAAAPASTGADLLPPTAFAKQPDTISQSMKSLSLNENNSWQTVGAKRSTRPGRGRGTTLASY